MPAMVDWNALVQDFGPMVVGISWRILGHAADAEDNVQETFLKAYQLGSRQKVRHWKGLLRRMAVCGALAKLRRRKPILSLEPESLASSQPPPEEEASARELRTRLRGAIANLPEREAAVFSLCYFEGLTLDEIAQSLAIRYSAAGAALSRARSKLERHVLTETAEKER